MNTVTNIRHTVLNELRTNRRTVTEVCQYYGFNDRQVRNAIAALDLSYHIDRVTVDGNVTYKVNRRRKVPMKAGIKRHIV